MYTIYAKKQTFESLRKLAWSRLAQYEQGADPARIGTASVRTEDRGFSGTPDLPAAIDVLKYGWKEVSSRIVREVETLTRDLVANNTQTIGMDVAGIMPCVPAVLSGDPECWYSMQESEELERRVNLHVELSYPYDTSTEQVTSFAIALAVTMKKLQLAGYSVGVMATDCGQAGRYTFIIPVEVFAPGEPFNVDKLASLYHPSFLRRIGFACREKFEDIVEYRGTAKQRQAKIKQVHSVTRGGYGPIWAANSKDLRHCFDHDGPVISFPHVFRMPKSVDACMKELWSLVSQSAAVDVD